MARSPTNTEIKEMNEAKFLRLCEQVYDNELRGVTDKRQRARKKRAADRRVRELQRIRNGR